MSSCRFRISLILVALLGLLGALPIYAAPTASCLVGATLDADTTWSSAECSAYLVSGSTQLTAGHTLTITSGTVVQFAPGAGLTIKGKLLAQGGTADNERIHFTSAQPNQQPGDWVGLILDTNSGPHVVQGLIIEYAGSTSGTFYDGGLIVFGTTATIDSNIIRMSKADGLRIVNSRPITVTNNLIRDNAGTGVRAYIPSGSSRIVNNIVQNNSRTGINLSGNPFASTASFLVDGNTIINNRSVDNLVLQGGGLAVGSGVYTITQNLITSNAAPNGGGVYARLSVLTATNNRIVGNIGLNGAAVYLDSASAQFRANDMVANSDTCGRTHAIFYSKNSGNETVDAQQNYWGTTDPNTISRLIWDRSDDALLQYVNVSAPLLVPANGAITQQLRSCVFVPMTQR